ncbi:MULTISPECIES: SIS domain-containing protein [unclassified Streptomyces]|uniref:SIS domain-containing protein n=1 Tax=unclassified Streptomyces TaxID=2593676 RepID=UPI0038275AE9
MTLSPFEQDIIDQPGALRDFARAEPDAVPPLLLPEHRERYDRIVLTGMGSSHFAALPTWRSLVSLGHTAWWADAGQLLDSPGLVTDTTLLVATSQSGNSAEIAALLDLYRASPRPRTIIGITNDHNSALATAADAVIDLRSGAEATVSTKSYLNTLAAHQQLLNTLSGHGNNPDAVTAAARTVEHLDPGPAVTDLARCAADTPRIAFIGNQDQAATALYAGLITKEAAKVPAEGYIGGQFRHGPMELAGPGLTAVLFGAWADDRSASLRTLAADLVASGSDVTLVGDLVQHGARTIEVPRPDALTELATSAVVAQHIAVHIARARGIEPGAFTYGSKITTAL